MRIDDIISICILMGEKNPFVKGKESVKCHVKGILLALVCSSPSHFHKQTS